MSMIGRVILLVAFGIVMVVLEVNAFSGPWTWTLYQKLFVLVAVTILAAWFIRRSSRRG